MDALSPAAQTFDLITATANAPDAVWGLLLMSTGLLIYASCLCVRDKFMHR